MVMAFLATQILHLLLWLNGFINNLGLTIIIITIGFRLVILAFTWKSLKSMKKLRSINGEIKEIQRKYKDNPEKMSLEQMALYKKYNVNPLAGCLPQLLQIFMLIAFYRALTMLLQQVSQDGTLETSFLWFDLIEADPYHIMPILAGGCQLFLSVMTLPGGETPDIVPNNSRKKEIQKLNEQEENTAEMAAAMQKQMLFMMPFMTGLIAWTLPAGLALYWTASTLFSICQQYFLSGWGGIVTYGQRFWRKMKGKAKHD